MDWRPIPGFPRYEVSDSGDVRRVEYQLEFVHRGKRRMRQYPAQVLTPQLDEWSGHPRVTLWNGRKCRSFFVHRLVAHAFTGPQPFPGAIVLRKNGVVGDNRAENLRWGSHAERIEMHRRPACKRGHERNLENTYVSPSGQRQCRECQKVRDRAKYLRRRSWQ